MESANVILEDLGSMSRECDDNRIDVWKDIQLIEDEKLCEEEEKKEKQWEKSDRERIESYKKNKLKPSDE